MTNYDLLTMMYFEKEWTDLQLFRNPDRLLSRKEEYDDILGYRLGAKILRDCGVFLDWFSDFYRWWDDEYPLEAQLGSFNRFYIPILQDAVLNLSLECIENNMDFDEAINEVFSSIDDECRFLNSDAGIDATNRDDVYEWTINHMGWFSCNIGGGMREACNVLADVLIFATLLDVDLDDVFEDYLKDIHEAIDDWKESNNFEKEVNLW